MGSRVKRKIFTLCAAGLCLILISFTAAAQSTRTLSGIVVTQQFELVPGVTIEVKTSDGKLTVMSDAEGRFSLGVPAEPLSVKFSGANIQPTSRIYSATEQIGDLQIKIQYVVPPINASVTITGNTLTPEVETRNDTVYKNTLFARDDQLIQTLNAGINAGQHEGGGKSLEIRRFGFNLDHGGINGGVKILVDDIQQNQATQGHGQGYLGALKSLTPELIDDVSIINGPFSAAYGDFSGLGVVQIRLRESLPQQFTARIQAGSFNTRRGFFAFSPNLAKIDAFFAYEPSYTDGPFESPLRYRRDNLTGNLTYKAGENEALGFKFNFGRNKFYSSGQIPLDLAAAGQLDRFGFVDPFDGGKIKLGTAAGYYRKEWKSGTTLKVDAFAGRSLFDLYSNFTFFLNDPVRGDEIQQHDSRLQEGANVQFLQPYKFFGRQALFTAGGNLHLNQINVGLFRTVRRDPFETSTQANIDINNEAGYVQNGIDFYHGHVHLETGLRWDHFSFDVKGRVNTSLSGKTSAAKFQPKLTLAWSPFEKTPATFYFNYGRGISSQDARGIVLNPDSPKISTTDFYQVGTSFNANRFSIVGTLFFIDRSNEQVYIPDDGSLEFKGPSRSYGFEIRNSVRISKRLSFNGGLTQVVRAFYPGQFTADNRRIIVDSAPHTVANGSIIVTEFAGFNSSLNWRHTSNYRLDGEDASIRASGLDIVDVSLAKRLRKWLDINFSVDNLLNKKYYETQNYFESRACPACAAVSRIHATPGYPITVNAGLTFRFGSKK
jgi:outer membrane receptor protein involved in Fe transport